MTREIQQALDELANSLQPATLITTQLIATTARTATDAVQLDTSIRRAVTAVLRLQAALKGEQL